MQCWLGKCNYLSTSTTVHLYQALVMSVLLYAAEIWTLFDADAGTLEAFHYELKCQKQMLHIHWWDLILSPIYIFIRHNNVEVFQRSGLPTISDIITSPSHVPGVTLHTWTREGVPPNT